MKIKLDENMPAQLVGVLDGLGHDTDTVPEENLAGGKDPAIWAATQKSSRFLITQDLDFSDIRTFQPGTHFGILLVRLRKPTRRALIARIRAIFELEQVERFGRCFVVATDSKLRIRGA
jgi:predicted nuclease of predicted toxin-antitoxin system